MSGKRFPAFILAFSALFSANPVRTAPVITSPARAGTTLAAGDDFATQVIGDAWDMDVATDFDAGESTGMSAQSIASGIYSATIASTSAGANFEPLSQGWGKQTLPHWKGELYPIDTSRYHNFTIKLKVAGGTGVQPVRAVFYRDGDSSGDGSYGSSFYKYIPQQGQWTIVSWDLLTETYSFAPYHLWTEYPKVHGLRFDFATDGGAGSLGASVQVAWMRMSAPKLYNVVWTDTQAGSYFITAIDAGGARYQFNSAPVNAMSYLADLALLAPGDYRIEVKDSTTSATATSGTIHINKPPQARINAPSVRGEQARSYAFATSGHQWGPLSASDFSQINNFASTMFANPPGSFYGRAANEDPQLWFTTNTPIDTDLYRSICVNFEVFGPRDVGAGSVARFFWGVVSGSMSSTEGFVLYNNAGINEYCFKDATLLPLDPFSPPAPWASSSKQNYFRFDPHEFAVDNTDHAHPSLCPTSPSPSNCHDIRLDTMTLSPFAQANPSYAFQWTLADVGHAANKLTLYLDPDMTQLNGNEIKLYSATAVPTGNGQYVWPGSGSVNYGAYNVLFVVDDGINSVAQYAGGPLIVGDQDGIFRNDFDSSP